MVATNAAEGGRHLKSMIPIHLIEMFQQSWCEAYGRRADPSERLVSISSFGFIFEQGEQGIFGCQQRDIQRFEHGETGHSNG